MWTQTPNAPKSSFGTPQQYATLLHDVYIALTTYMQCIIGHEIWVVGQSDSMRFGTCSCTHGMLIFYYTTNFLKSMICRRQSTVRLLGKIKVKVKWSRYRPGVAQRVGRGIALLFHDRGTRRGWVVSSTPRPHFTPGKDQVPVLQEAGWIPGPVWTGGKSRPHRDSIPDRPDRSQPLYRLSYPTQLGKNLFEKCPRQTSKLLLLFSW